MDDDDDAEFEEYLRSLSKKKGPGRPRKKKLIPKSVSNKKYQKQWTSSPTFKAVRSAPTDDAFYKHYDLWDAHGTDLRLVTTLRDVRSYLRSGKKTLKHTSGFS